MRVTVETICPVCGKLSWVVVEESDLFAWQNGALVQDAFPYLSAEERELFISGICSDCWDRMFGAEETKELELEEEEEEEEEEKEKEEEWKRVFDALDELFKLIEEEEDC